MPPSIFQQIVLPYLSYRSLASSARFARLFSSSIARERAAADADPSSSSSTPISHGPSKRWDYVPPISPMPYDAGHDPPLQPRPRSRARIPLPPAVQSNTSGMSGSLGGTAAEVLAFLRSLEESKGGRQATLMMALEKIASIPDHLVEREAAEEERVARRLEDGPGMDVKPERKKGRIRDSGPQPSRPPDIAKAVASAPASSLTPVTPESGVACTSLTTSPTPIGPPLPVQLSERLRTTHFPPIIYTLLRTRLYRLAVYHLLLTPEYAVDQPLLDRVAEYMRLDGAGKLARRLEKGWDGTHDGTTPLPHLTPFGSHLRRHPDAWLLSRRAAARPIPSDGPTLAALTANYNSHLTRSLLSTKKGSSSSSTQSHSSNPLTPLNNMLTSSHPLAKPSGGMRQLRQLLHKIERLERHRSFRPDWVTANLVVKCWMSCLMAGGSGWKAGAAGSGGGAGEQEREIDKRGELRGLFGFVRALFEKGLDEQAAWAKGMAGGIAGPSGEVPPSSQPSTSTLSSPSESTAIPPSDPSRGVSSQRIPTPKPYNYPQALSYTRHVRPFANDLLRAFREIGDRYAVGRVIEWQKEMKTKMEGEHPGLRVGQPKRVEFGKRSGGKG